MFKCMSINIVVAIITPQFVATIASFRHAVWTKEGTVDSFTVLHTILANLIHIFMPVTLTTT